MQEVWGPVLGQSFFGSLIVPSNWGLEHGHSSMSLDDYFLGDTDPFL